MKFQMNIQKLEPYFIEHEKSELADRIINEFYLSLSEEEGKQIKEKVETEGKDLNEAYAEQIISGLDDDSQEVYNAVLNGYGLDHVVLLDKEKYTENAYYKKLREIEDFSKDTIEFRQNKIHAYIPVAINEKVVHEDRSFADESPIGCYREDFEYPAILQDGRVWMSFAPHETETSEEALEHAHGNVVTYGMGLGYFPFMASEKEDVTSVTIVEFDPEIIELFKEYFLPVYNHPEKIRIVNGDALKFAAETAEPYDCLFADIWHDAEDGLPFYLKFIKDEHAAKVVDYWIEKDMLVYFRRHVLTLLEEAVQGYDDSDYEVMESFSDRLLTALHRTLKDTVIKDTEDVDKLLSDEGLRELAKKLPDLDTL